MPTSEVVPGVHRIEHAGTNCYLVERADTLTFVDAGLPGTWSQAQRLVRELGRTWADVDGIVLTHAHFDHLGFARRAQRERGVPVWAHVDDHPIALRPYRYRPGRPRVLYPLRHPRSIPVLARMVGAGALWVRGVDRVETLRPGGDDGPGGLRVVATPGHTRGHCVLSLPDLDVVFSGDALVTLDPYTGRVGPRVVARAGTEDARQALGSLEAVAATGATVVLPGHGDPWTTGADAAVERALEAGVA